MQGQGKMLVFIEKRLVLLATPKTGSTALHSALAPHADMVFRNLPQVKHMSLRRYLRFVAPLVAQYSDQPMETCALIRAPEDWLGSWYRYRQRDAIAAGPRSTRGLTFEAFVAGYLSSPPPPPAAVGVQSRFLSGPRGEGSVDVLFRYEAFEAFRQWLSQRLDLPIALGQENVSPQGAPLDLSDTMRARLHAKCAACFRLHEGARA